MRHGPKPNASDPRAIGECDRCAKVYFRHELQRQMIVAGMTMRWEGALVCPKCQDKPNPQDRSQRLKPDPVPVRNPRPVRDGPTRVADNWPPSGPTGGRGSF